MNSGEGKTERKFVSRKITSPSESPDLLKYIKKFAS